MTIGVLKEPAFETRVSLLAEAVTALTKKNITVFKWMYLHLFSKIKFSIYCLFTDKNGNAINNQLARIITKYCN